MELESYKDGTLLHIGGAKGAKIQVDELLAIVGKPGEDVSALVKGGNGAAEPQAQTNQPATGNGQPATAQPQAASSSQPKPAPQSSPSVDVL